MENLPVLPLHKFPQYLIQCCKLINDEWKRSETARLRSLEASCDALPTSLVLIKNNRVIGHCKLSPIPSIKYACFVESVVVDKSLRGKGHGTYLMAKAEEYCRNNTNVQVIYLSTHDKVEFYKRIGYENCPPVNIFGGFAAKVFGQGNGSRIWSSSNNTSTTGKVYMKKVIVE